MPAGCLQWFDDAPPHEPAHNMAADEALLAQLPPRTLRLRCYRWSSPAVSFGYFLRHRDVAALFPGRPLVRRWTGGGAVDHADDFTFAIAAPPDHPLFRQSPSASYRAIHSALAAAIAAATPSAPTLAAVRATPSPPGGACFTRPVPADLVIEGRKIAGGAQRRSRRGLLHQGSVQGIRLPPGFGAILARHLADAFGTPAPDPFLPGAAFARLATHLAETRYGTEQWLKRR